MRNRIFVAFEITIFCAFLYSMNCFWFWNFRLPYFNLCAIVLLLILKAFNRNIYKLNRRSFFISILFFLAQIFGNNALADISKFGGALIYSFIVYLFLSLRWEYQKHVFNFIYDKLAVILAISLILFILVIIGIPLPNFGYITHPTLDFYSYTNYGLLLHGIYGIRFNSIFCEPGHLGMIIAFLLFINGYDFKNKSTIILILSLLFTLSLAGYVLAAVGYILLQMKQNFKSTLLRLFKASALFSLVYLFTINYNNGNNLVNELIFSRLEYDPQEGTIAGDNRASNSLNNYYESLSYEEFLFGIGQEKYTDESSNGLLSGAGYKLFIVIAGVFGVVVVSVFYLSIVITSKKTIRMEYFFLLILYALCFIQRAYPFWAAEVFTFILAGGYFLNSKTNIQISLKNRI